MQKLLLQRLSEIGESLEHSGRAVALLGLGSVGIELHRIDEYSDLDFFAIVEDGQKGQFIDDLAWLSDLAPVAYAFRNTVDGFKLLYRDGVFCEFAVFELHELAGIPFAPGRLVWKAEHVDDSISFPVRTLPASEFNLEWNVGEALTNIYIGLKRFARGEKLTAARFVQQHAVDRILELAASQDAPQPDVVADPFNLERRIEQRFPEFSQSLADFVQGYDRTPESASAMLTWLEANFEIDSAMAAAIRSLMPGAAY
jgi:lincosamide nucleotidyltransferase B/F